MAAFERYEHKDAKIRIYDVVLQTSPTRGLLILLVLFEAAFWSDRTPITPQKPSRSPMKSPGLCSQVAFPQSMQSLGVMHYGILPEGASQNARASRILGPHMRDGHGVG